MSDEYTPTTNVVRGVYAESKVESQFGEWAKYEREFDRWLADVRAKAIEDWASRRASMGSHDPYVDRGTRDGDLWDACRYAQELREGKR